MLDFLLKSVGIYNEKRLEYGKNPISEQNMLQNLNLSQRF